MLDAAELRRASATDAGAVAQYLSAIDSDELDALLDAFADAERKKKDDSDALEWRALVHVLLRTHATRQRTATRILQSLWRGHASEMEALRWVSEISLAYMASAAPSHESQCDMAAELRVVLQISLQFVRDAMAATKNKALPQLLALVPVLLQLLAEATSRTHSVGCAPKGAEHTESESLSIVHEHVVQLLELPWDLRSVPHLLELLREHTTLVSKSGWTQLRQSVEQLITPSTASDVPTECINPLIRECLLLAASATEAQDDTAAWIRMARVLLRRLPSHMRQEAEFNMHMSLHQYPLLASVICDVLLAFAASPSPLALDASDAVLLLHAIRASKPLLHHHLVGSALAATANDSSSVFRKAQRLILRVLDPLASEPAATKDRSLRQTVTSILEFGGRQLHARVWKAQLLHELARLWAREHDAQVDMGVLVTESVFTTVPEVREEILQGLIESSRVAAQSERALRQLGRLVRHQKTLVTPYRQLLENWLSSLASVSHHATQLQTAFSSVAPLVAFLKDFYNFAMVLLRKHLSSPHTLDRQLAVDVWCTWLETALPLDPQQQEEVVLAIKHAVQLRHDRAWTFCRLAQLFDSRSRGGDTSTDTHSLHEASLVELHRLFASALREFVEPATVTTPFNRKSDSESESDGNQDALEEDPSPRRRHLRRFGVSTLDALFAYNGSIGAALRLGALLESIVACLVGVERAMRAVKLSASSVHRDAYATGHDVLRWLDVFVRDREEFFQWVSSGHDAALRVGDPRFAWALAARVSLGCAFCHLALRQYIATDQASSGNRIHRRVWELLESQLSLARLWRKFSATTPMADPTLLQKDQQLDAMMLHTAASTVRPFASQLLRGVVKILHSPRADSASTRGASLDGVLFLLDAYTHSLAPSPQSPPLNTNQLAAELHALVCIYTAVAASMATASSATVGAAPPVARFTTYGETLATQFPVSMRHLVDPDSATTLAVTLDARATEELASRVCVALSKTVSAMARRLQLRELLDALASLVSKGSDCIGDETTVSLGDIASRLLEDVKHVMDHDGFAKFRLAGVALVRKLVELLAQDSDWSLVAVADTAYELLCDHVVHQPPLLRGLLALSFPSTSRGGEDDVVIDRSAVVLAACGFRDQATARAEDAKEETKPPSAKKNEKKKRKDDEIQPVRRRRLRQISDDEEDEEEDAGETNTITGDDGITHSGDPSSSSNQEPQAHEPKASVSASCQRQPRFTTAASQSAALTAVLNVLESLHARTLPLLTALVRSRAPCGREATTASLLQAARIQSLVASSVFASPDISWINSRTLAKLSSVVEAAVRIGKQCCASCRFGRGDHAEGEDDRQVFVQGFTASVAVTVRGRAWLALLRDAATQPSAKSKLSATILKLDVFLLDVPTLVASLMKAEAVPLASKRDLRVFLSTVESDLAHSTSMATSTSVVTKNQPNKTTKRHLVGVVPIVHTKRRKRLRSRHAFIDSCLADEDGDDAFADLEDFIA